MKHVVVRPSGDLSRVYILPEEAQLTLPFESWALRDGKQIVFATIKMHKVLQTQHLLGSYETGAMYAYTYDEMCAIMSSHLGLSDRERYEASLKEGSEPILIEGNVPHDYLGGRYRAAYILWKTLVLIVKLFIKGLNTVLFLVLLPLIIKWFNGFNK